MAYTSTHLRPLALTLAASLAFLLAPAAAAERTIAYSDLHPMFARLEKLKGGKYFHADARLISKDPEVPTEKLTLVIQSKSGERIKTLLQKISKRQNTEITFQGEEGVILQ